MIKISNNMILLVVAKIRALMVTTIAMIRISNVDLEMTLPAEILSARFVIELI